MTTLMLLTPRPTKLMLGYLNRPEQTAKRLRHGWLYTGDLVYRDDDQFYYYLDRLDDAIAGRVLSWHCAVRRWLCEHDREQRDTQCELRVAHCGLRTRQAAPLTCSSI